MYLVYCELWAFGDLWRKAIYFQGSGKNGHSFPVIWDASTNLGGSEEKRFKELGRKTILLSRSREVRPPHLVGSHLQYCQQAELRYVQVHTPVQ